MQSDRNPWNLALAFMLGFALTGCGNKPGTPPMPIARVNGDAITSEQLNLALSRLNITSPDQIAAAKRQVLQALVDQQLLVQQAIQQKLDRDPAVAQLLEASRRQILAQAYLERQGQGLPKASEKEVTDYYNQHPELFGERRVYRLQELGVNAANRVEEVRSRLEGSRDLGEFSAWLRAENIPFRAGSGIKAAEQLPMEIVPRLQGMQEGQFLAIPAHNGVTVLQIVAVQREPMTLEKARPAIERLLMTAKRREAAEAELKKLQASARIEYPGEFAGSGKPSGGQPQGNAGLPEIK